MIKIFSKKIIKFFGYDIHKLSLYEDHEFHLIKCIKNYKIDLIIDVGANRGQFAEKIFSSNYKGEIVSIEPLSAAWLILNKKASGNKKWNVFRRSGLGAISCTDEINIARNLDSSSFLPMAQAHLSAAPWSEFCKREKCDVYALDDIYDELIVESDKQVMLKIDCQGFEDRILQGAENTLKKIALVLTEVSLKELYTGQSLWMEIIHHMESRGYKIYSVLKGFTDPVTGETLQLDILFAKSNV